MARGESTGSNAPLFVEIEVVVGKIAHDIVESIDKIDCVGAVVSAVGERSSVRSTDANCHAIWRTGLEVIGVCVM